MRFFPSAFRKTTPWLVVFSLFLSIASCDILEDTGLIELQPTCSNFAKKMDEVSPVTLLSRALSPSFWDTRYQNNRYDGEGSYRLNCIFETELMDDYDYQQMPAMKLGVEVVQVDPSRVDALYEQEKNTMLNAITNAFFDPREGSDIVNRGALKTAMNRWSDHYADEFVDAFSESNWTSFTQMFIDGNCNASVAGWDCYFGGYSLGGHHVVPDDPSTDYSPGSVNAVFLMKTSSGRLYEISFTLFYGFGYDVMAVWPEESEVYPLLLHSYWNATRLLLNEDDLLREFLTAN